jgi:hypothetical protein
MSKGMRAKLVSMPMRRQKKYRKLMMDQLRVWMTEGTAEPRMSTGMTAMMATMYMRRKKHCKRMMDQRSMWRTEGLLLESVKIGKTISDM